MDAFFLGQIEMISSNDIPEGWMLCNGAILPIHSHEALFSILGTIYGGDGRTSFALPDLRGRFPIGEGQGAGLMNHQLGSQGGITDVSLNTLQIPSHNHSIEQHKSLFNIGYSAEGAPGGTPNPGNGYLAQASQNMYTTNETEATKEANRTVIDVNIVSSTVYGTGASLPHNNLQPFQAIQFIIATYGPYPTRA